MVKKMEINMFSKILFWLYVNLPIRWRYRSYFAEIDCPDNEPLHFHHDGCPCCEGMN
jgi:hypothetical protein